jgi:hypothetical protein
MHQMSVESKRIMKSNDKATVTHVLEPLAWILGLIESNL